MSDSEEKKTAVGTVEEVLPDSLFRVRISPQESSVDEPGVEAKIVQGGSPEAFDEALRGELVPAYLAGKIRLHRIRVLVGDQVEMVIDPYGGRARIVRRLT